jgi:signal transduction histidine kinase
MLQSFFESPGAMRGLVEVMGDDVLHVQGNTAAAEFLGLAREAMRHRRASALGVPKRTVRTWLAHLEASERDKQPITFDFLCPARTGARWLRATVSSLGAAPDGPSWRVRCSYEVFDITEARETEDALKREKAERAASEARERRTVVEERTRFAREMHDTIAQGLAGVVIQLEAAKDALAGDPAAAEAHIERACSLARESLAGARRSVWALRPDAMERGPLPTALAHLVHQMASGVPAQISLITTGDDFRLHRQTEDELLRIGQEAIANALKHSQATEIRVTLDFDTGRVELSVHDNGRGFDPSSPLRPGGLGLRGMQERSARVGGSFTVSSAPGQGTRVTIQVPTPPGQGGYDGK